MPNGMQNKVTSKVTSSDSIQCEMIHVTKSWETICIGDLG